MDDSRRSIPTDGKSWLTVIGRILRDSALEMLLTFLMLFGVTSIVRWVIGPSPISRMIPQIHAELLIVGAERRNPDRRADPQSAG